MKKIVVLLFILPLFTFAQTGGQGWGAFVRYTSIEASWRGKPFLLSAKVKAKTANKDSWAGIWVRNHDVNNKMSFFDNMGDRGIRSDTWTSCEIKTTFKSNDSIMVFGGLYIGPGKYGFDDFVLQVETMPGKWEPIVSEGLGFDDSTALKKWSIPHDSTQIFSIRETALEVDADKMAVPVKKEKSIYGDNTKAGHFANVNGIKIYYEIYGKGKPVLLLHGNSQGIKVFSYLIPSLAKNYKVIAMDTRLQGRSGDDGKRLTYDLFAEDVKALLGHLKLKNVNVLGWSDGGNTGLILASKYPQYVKSLITMGANLQPDTSAVKQEVLEKSSEVVARMTPEMQKEKRLYTLCLEEPHISLGQIKSIQCPVLVMAGDNDMIKDGHTRLIASTIPKGELLIFEKATHFAPFEIPDRFGKAVEDFFKKHQ